MKLKLGYEQAKSAQQYQVFASIVSAALGGKKETKPPASFDEAEAQLSAVLGKR